MENLNSLNLKPEFILFPKIIFGKQYDLLSQNDNLPVLLKGCKAIIYTAFRAWQSETGTFKLLKL